MQLCFPAVPAVIPAAAAKATYDIASRMSHLLHLGTSSWTFPGWNGLVYDGHYADTTLARAGLAAYAQHPLLRCVGIDRAHYRPVPVAELRHWASVVPTSFRFVMKAHDALTLHTYPSQPRYGPYAGQPNPRFLDPGYARDAVIQPYCEGLGAQGGAILFQFAAQDMQPLGGPLGFAARLGSFLSALPAGPTYAVEVRNAPLLTRAYAQALSAANAVHCFNILPNMPDVRSQARLLAGVRFNTLVLRWMRHDGIGYEEAVQRYRPFNRLAHPDPQARADVAWLCNRAMAAKVSAVYVVVNNKAEGCAPLSICELARRLATGE